jgi:5,10-methenyltetrahydrofolate synthetase
MTTLSIQDLRRECITKRISLSQDIHYVDALKRLQFNILMGLDDVQIISNKPIERIGFYSPIRHEPDITQPLIEWQMRGLNRLLALPITTPNQPLRFMQWDTSTLMTTGYANIPEPYNSELIDVDVILAPCVGFSYIESKFWRLGYGGGFYDRTLSHVSQNRVKPFFIGVGFDILRLDDSSWTPSSHDWPMDMMITESSFQYSEHKNVT